MGIIEIISAIVLVIACIFIILVVLMQDTKQGMSQTIAGGSADNYYQRNQGRSNEAKLNKLTKIAAIIFFVVALAVNFVVMYSGNFASLNNSSNTSSTSSAVTSTESETSDASSDASTEESTASDSSAESAESTESTESSDTASTESTESSVDEGSIAN